MTKRLTDLRRLATSQLGEEVGVLMRFIARPGVIRAQSIKEGIWWAVYFHVSMSIVPR